MPKPATSYKTSLWRPDIQGLRGIAILAVLVFHAAPRWLPGGFVGVDIFFVLSGFLVFQQIKTLAFQERFNLASFYIRRARRLLPSLLLVLVSTTAVASLIMSGYDIRAVARQASASALFLGNFEAWRQSGYFDGDASLKPLIHLWSLGIEEQFYLLFPLIAVTLLKRSRNAITWGAAVLGGISFCACWIVTTSHPEAAFYWPITRFWEFLAGALVVQLSEITTSARRGSIEILAICVLVLLAISMFLIDSTPAFPGWIAIFPVASAVGCIMLGEESKVLSTFLRQPAFTFLGRISYSAYLWHWPILALCRYRYPGIVNAYSGLALDCLAIALAIMSTILLEEPIRYRRWKKDRQVMSGLVIAMGIVVVAIVPLMDALALRDPLLKLDAYALPNNDAWRSKDGCFLARNEDVDFGSSCTGGTADGRPLAILWGDSHAASLYQGLATQANQRGYRLAQFTASSCSPLTGLAGDDNIYCADIQNRALHRIASLHPSEVILFSHWNKGYEKRTLSLLGNTINQLRQIGVPQVVVIGPLPLWKPSLPGAMAIEMREHHSTKYPETVEQGISPDPFSLDASLATTTAASNGQYVSVLKQLCQEQRCRAWVDAEHSALMSFDDAHLTVEGSVFLAAKIGAEVFR